MLQVYQLNKIAPIGTTCECPSCGASFTKKKKDQCFCRTRIGTICKDKFWNTIDPDKRNNSARIKAKMNFSNEEE